MPGCCISYCNNRLEKGFRLFHVPRNKERRKEWLQLIKREELPERAAVCEVHFGDDQFESRREDGKRLLRPFGKPNLLQKLEEKEDQFKAATTSLSSHVDNIEINEEKSNATNKNSCVNNSDNMDITLQTEASNVSCTSHKTYDEKYVQKLKKTLHSTREQCRRLKKKLQNNKDYLKIIFNEDQTNFITYSTKKGSLWSAITINKALRLYTACGHKGYEEIRHQGLPYPSIRTLQHRIQSLKFKPGIFEDVFAMLKLKIQTFNDQKKYAVLLIDEMAIKPGLKYDNSISAVIAILYYIDRGDIANKHKTTAWFLNCMHKWFKLMTSRYQKLALSHFNKNEYTETITFFKEFLEIVRGIRVGDGKWKPFQSGLLLCTQTALDVQAEYLQTYCCVFDAMIIT